MKTLSFEGSGSEYFKIWIVNIFLTIITLGLYYPWAKVRNNRYFYANSTLEGRNFEYHATGKQLFVGYLIAMALLITYIVVEQFSPVGSLILIVVLMLAVPLLIVRSMMFTMKMTSFSNVHFAFEGKTAQAYINFLAYPIAMYVGFVLMGLAIGVVMPLGGLIGGLLVLAIVVGMLAFSVFAFAFIKKKSTEFFIDNSRYGQGGFKTDVELKQLMMITFKTFGVAMLVFLVFGVIASVVASQFVGMEALSSLQGMEEDPELFAETIGAMLPLLVGGYALLIFVSIFIMAYSVSRHREYIYAHTTLDDKVTFSSTLKAMPFAWLLVSNILLVIMTLGLALPWTKVRAAKMVLENTSVKSEDGFDNYLTQKQDQTSSLGEQIGDAFDVDVGIGI